MAASRLLIAVIVVKKILYSVGLTLVTVMLVLGGLTALSYLEKERWKHQVTEAVQRGHVELYRVSTDWNVQKDYRLDATIWIKNNGTSEVAGTWVFRLSLDHSRLEEKFLKHYVKAHAKDYTLQQIEKGRAREVSTPKAKAIEAFIRRGKKVLPTLSHERVLLGSENPKAFVIMFRSMSSLKAGEIGKIEHHLEVPPEEVGYEAEISLDHVEPR